jgi:hypothetical protein
MCDLHQEIKFACLKIFSPYRTMKFLTLFIEGDECQELSNVVQACPKSGQYKDYELSSRLMPLIHAKCSQGFSFDFLFPRRHKHPRAVTFKECLEFTGKWRMISLARFIDHMERHGGPAYGGCLGHMVFDMLAVKATNPLIPLPGARSGKGDSVNLNDITKIFGWTLW